MSSSIQEVKKQKRTLHTVTPIGGKAELEAWRLEQAKLAEAGAVRALKRRQNAIKIVQEQLDKRSDTEFYAWARSGFLAYAPKKQTFLDKVKAFIARALFN